MMDMQSSLMMSPTSEDDFSWAAMDSQSSHGRFCPTPSSDESSLLDGVGDEKDKKKSSTYKHVPHREKPPHLVARRNARERRRVQAVNGVFAKLRKCVPIENRSKRLSKVKTLHKAIEYIAALQRLLEEADAADNDKINNNNNNSSSTTSANTSYEQIGEVSSTSSFKQEQTPLAPETNWTPTVEQFPAGQEYQYSLYQYQTPTTYSELQYPCTPLPYSYSSSRVPSNTC